MKWGGRQIPAISIIWGPMPPHTHIIRIKVIGNDGSQGVGRLPLGEACQSFTRSRKVRSMSRDPFLILTSSSLGAH